jgi:hypothetical protein
VRRAKAVGAARRVLEGRRTLSAHARRRVFHRKVIVTHRPALRHARVESLVGADRHAAARGVERAARAPHLAADSTGPTVGQEAPEVCVRELPSCASNLSKTCTMTRAEKGSRVVLPCGSGQGPSVCGVHMFMCATAVGAVASGGVQ